MSGTIEQLLASESCQEQFGRVWQVGSDWNNPGALQVVNVLLLNNGGSEHVNFKRLRKYCLISVYYSSLWFPKATRSLY